MKKILIAGVTICLFAQSCKTCITCNRGVEAGSGKTTYCKDDTYYKAASNGSLVDYAGQPISCF